MSTMSLDQLIEKWKSEAKEGRRRSHDEDRFCSGFVIRLAEHGDKEPFNGSWVLNFHGTTRSQAVRGALKMWKEEKGGGVVS